MMRIRKLLTRYLLTLVGGFLAHTAHASQVGFSVINTGFSAPTQEALVVASGSWFKRRALSQSAFLVEHPKGNVLIDSGLGRHIDEQFASNSFFYQQVFRYQDVNPAADQLAANEALQTISKVIPTHLHWDHASGIVDFPEAEIWVTREEYNQAIAGLPPVHIPSQLNHPDTLWRFFELQNKSYEGFRKSYDLYGDGSIVLVDLSGHSAGQVGVFVTVSSGQQYFLIGDTTWTIKGIRDQSQRSDLIKWLVEVNWNTAKNAERMKQIGDVGERSQAVKIVPAHDEIVMKTLPIYPEVGY